MSLYVKIRQWFQPYWKPVPDELRDKSYQKPKSEKIFNKVESSIGKDKIEKLFKASTDKKYRDSLLRKKKSNAVLDDDHPELIMRIFQANKPLDKVMESTQKPKQDTIWYYHDSRRHQIYAHLMPGTGFRVPGSERSDKDRAKLKPKLKPLKSPGYDEPYDRTHLLPFGYHGSENDPRLVVGWSRAENRNGLAEFEMRAKKLGYPIFWLTDIRRTKYGAIWRYVVCKAETNEVIMSYVSRMGTEDRPIRFEWSDE